MKTIEFKIYPTVAQAQTIDLWLEQLKWVWNRGLSLRFAARQQYYREKEASDRAIPEGLTLKWKWRKNGEKWQKIRLVGQGVIRPKNGYPYCEIREHRDIEDIQKFSSGSAFYRSDNIPEWLRDVPTKFKTGVADALKEAWKAYSDPKRPTQKPRFKGRRDKLRSLTNGNAGGVSKELKPQRIGSGDNAYVQFPKLGKIRVKGLYKRHDWNDWGTARLLKEPSGYYLQVCIPSESVELPASNKAVGIDPGLKSILTTDAGREVEPPKLYRKQQKRLRRLQRKVSRQQKGSNNQKKTRQAIARLHEKIRRSRNAFNHKLSTKIVREYGAVAMENLQIKNLIRRPKAKKREDGKGYEQNGASRKSGLNKSFADSALGDLIAKIETKCKAGGREFVKVPAQYTTVNCSNCGAEVKKSLSVRTHRCSSCGFVDDRDANAAKNILIKGRKLFDGVYRAWAWEDKPAPDSQTECQQEDAQVSPESEYDSQLTNNRGWEDNKPLCTPRSTSSPCTATDSTNATNSYPRDPSPTSNTAIYTNISSKRKRKRRTPAQIDPEIGLQLDLWSIGLQSG